MKYAACLLMALPLAATAIQSGVSITESNCQPFECTVTGSYAGFATDTFSASVAAYGDNQGGNAAQGLVTIDVTGQTLGRLESGWIEFSYPCCSGEVDAGGFASTSFQVGNVEGGLSGEVGQPHPQAGTLIPFEVGETFDITMSAEFDAPASSGNDSGAAQLNMSFQIFDSQMTPLVIYDQPNNAAATPEPATWLLMLFGLLAISCNLNGRSSSSAVAPRWKSLPPARLRDFRTGE